jgi:hypothetical protein
MGVVGSSTSFTAGSPLLPPRPPEIAALSFALAWALPLE